MQKITARLEAVLITPAQSLESEIVSEGIVSFEGLQGDYHNGYTIRSGGRQPEYPRGTQIRNRRQISLLSVEELAETAAELGIPVVQPQWLAGNLVISGLRKLSLLPPNARFFFSGGVVLVNDGENFPCSQPAKVTQKHHTENPGIAAQFVKASMHRRGLVAWVEHPGIIKPGETCQVEIPKPWINYWEDQLT
ncbi:MAG: molybdenum cofactor sulfurase [Chloroflexi bacterium HGW-Chloroflexi-10]|nr:MAG: molybdenum cofactor sulfurase [Chloroflexi bacterium HGW-Chloroflexi-10]